MSTNNDQLIPVMMSAITHNNIKGALSYLKGSTFVVKLYVTSPSSNYGLDPFVSCYFSSSLPNRPTGCFILTLIGTWSNLKKLNYSALQYTISHAHDPQTNNQATRDALDEMDKHINNCFTHPVAQEMIAKGSEVFSGCSRFLIKLGLVISIGQTTAFNTESTTVRCVDPSNTSHQYSILYVRSSLRPRPSVGVLCLFAVEESQDTRHNQNVLYFFDRYNLPIINLSQHTQFMTSYNPDDLPQLEGAAYRELITKWKNEKLNKQIFTQVPGIHDLNPYAYYEAWNTHIKFVKDQQQKLKKSVEQYKTFSSQQQAMHITSSIQQDHQKHIHNIDPQALPSGITNIALALSKTLYNEYYTQHITNQLNDLKTIDHLQYYQQQQQQQSLLSLTDHSQQYRRRYTNRSHLALPPPKEKSQIDTLIHLAALLPPIEIDSLSTTTSTNQNGQRLSDDDDLLGMSTTTTTTTTTIPRSKLNLFNHFQQKQKQPQIHHNQLHTTLWEHYNILIEQKHTLQAQYDELSILFEDTLANKNDKIATLKEQVYTQIPVMEQQITTLKQRITALEQQLTACQDELVTTKEQYEEEISTLQEQCRSQEIQAKDLIISAYAKMSNLNGNGGGSLSSTNKMPTNTNLDNSSNNNDSNSMDLSNVNSTTVIHTTIPPHINNQISFLQQQLHAKDQQLETKDKQLEAKDQHIAQLMQMLADLGKK